VRATTFASTSKSFKVSDQNHLWAKKIRLQQRVGAGIQLNILRFALFLRSGTLLVIAMHFLPNRTRDPTAEPSRLHV
jgi:hypothetical protein